MSNTKHTCEPPEYGTQRPFTSGCPRCKELKFSKPEKAELSMTWHENIDNSRTELTLYNLSGEFRVDMLMVALGKNVELLENTIDLVLAERTPWESARNSIKRAIQKAWLQLDALNWVSNEWPSNLKLKVKRLTTSLSYIEPFIKRGAKIKGHKEKLFNLKRAIFKVSYSFDDLLMEIDEAAEDHWESQQGYWEYQTGYCLYNDDAHEGEHISITDNRA